MNSRLKMVLQIVVILVVIAALFLGIAYFGAFNSSAETHQVTFRVESSGGYANVTLDAGKEKITKPSTITTPWERTITIQRGIQVILTASNPTQTGTITCAINLEYLPWKSDKTIAPKDGVACGGIVP